MTTGNTTLSRSATLAFFFAGVVAAVASCSGPPEGEMQALSFPPASTFPPVGEALHAHCGTLDCHGQEGRNLKLYGANGLRLDPTQVPGGGVTTEAELAENYRSVIALEPELTSLVVAEGGVAPERLTLVRKGRGIEHHKGEEAMDAGDPTDRCLLSWLASQVDVEACAAAAEVLRPTFESMAPATPGP